MKPILNLSDAVFDDIEENGLYTSQRASLSKHIGARKLGYNLSVLPPGGPEVAHQIINTGNTNMRYLALSTRSEVEVCEYPDSQKIMSWSAHGVRKLFRSENTVDYYDREKT